MRDVKKIRVKVADATSADGFEKAINEILDKADDPEITFDTNRPFLAYVKYTEIVSVPDCLRDAYEMRGDYHFCEECPYFIEPTDGRRKYERCEVGEPCKVGKPACNLYYKMLTEGTLQNPKKVIWR